MFSWTHILPLCIYAILCYQCVRFHALGGIGQFLSKFHQHDRKCECIGQNLDFGLCDPIEPFVTIVILDCLLASHKWCNFLKSIKFQNLSLILSWKYQEKVETLDQSSISIKFHSSKLLLRETILWTSTPSCQGATVDGP